MKGNTMARVNKKSATNTPKTFEGGKAVKLTVEQQLRRSVMACMLFEDTFYEDGQAIADRIKDLSSKVDAQVLNSVILDAKFKGKLRHSPLFLASSAMDKVTAGTLAQIFTRPDDITDLLAMWVDEKGKRKPIKRKMKNAINVALNTFDAYQLAKYKGSKTDAVKLVDVLNLTHPKPKDEAQAILFRSLMNGGLKPADTWEVSLSAGRDKKETFTRLMEEGTLGGMAFFKNVRNMLEAGVDEKLMLSYIEKLDTRKLMPMNLFASAYITKDMNLRIAAAIERKLVEMVKHLPKLAGKTAIVIDTSGSMWDRVSAKSVFSRRAYSIALATILQGICEESQVIFFNTHGKTVKGKTGLALYSAAEDFSGGTDHGAGLRLVDKDVERVIMLTDEQTSSNERFKFDKAYMVNLAAYQNSIAFDEWVSITGFSEKFIDFIFEYEALR